MKLIMRFVWFIVEEHEEHESYHNGSGTLDKDNISNTRLCKQISLCCLLYNRHSFSMSFFNFVGIACQASKQLLL